MVYKCIICQNINVAFEKKKKLYLNTSLYVVYIVIVTYTKRNTSVILVDTQFTHHGLLPVPIYTCKL